MEQQDSQSSNPEGPLYGLHSLPSDSISCSIFSYYLTDFCLLQFLGANETKLMGALRMFIFLLTYPDIRLKL